MRWDTFPVNQLDKSFNQIAKAIEKACTSLRDSDRTKFTNYVQDARKIFIENGSRNAVAVKLGVTAKNVSRILFERHQQLEDVQHLANIAFELLSTGSPKKYMPSSIEAMQIFVLSYFRQSGHHSFKDIEQLVLEELSQHSDLIPYNPQVVTDTNPAVQQFFDTAHKQFKNDNFAGASVSLTEAISLSPGNFLLQEWLANVYIKWGDDHVAEAIDILERGIPTIHTTASQAWNLAALIYKTRDVDKSLEVLHQHFLNYRLRPKHIRAIARLAIEQERYSFAHNILFWINNINALLFGFLLALDEQDNNLAFTYACQISSFAKIERKFIKPKAPLNEKICNHLPKHALNKI